MNRLRFRLDLASLPGRVASILSLVFFCSALSGWGAQPLWNTVGPPGGDARALAAVPGQPRHLYLGTTDSWLYESMDGGASWHRLSKLDSSGNLILDHIVVDPENPKTVFVAAWKLDHPGGGLWVSHNGGQSWSEIAGLHGQSIRAFAQAPSNPKMLFAGTLEGVFQSSDGGATWALISPPASKEIHEIESLAIDPNDPTVVYAGTWHLPWKTTDGGENWHNIKKGVIDDSDVFSIIVDPEKPKTVYASACTGIYKSENAGELFKKVEGIPSTARRTRVLKQDPQNLDVVYAGTTEGLYKTTDAGKHFERMTGPEVIVNDVFVDPKDPKRVLVAADRAGVLLSTDGGATFTASNAGFSGRKVEALLVDGPSGKAGRLFAGVVNDKTFGGVFVSVDGGQEWEQIADGLEGRDVFALAQAPDGTILAGTNRGIFALNESAPADPPGAGDTAPTAAWSPRDTIENTLAKTAVETHFGKQVHVEKHVKETSHEMTGRVYALDLSGDAWVASTTGGLFTSNDKGTSWQGGPVMGAVNYFSVAAHGAVLAAVRQDGAVISKDAGQSWMPMGIPAMLSRVHCVAFAADGSLWLGANEGVYLTRDLGHTWMWVNRLPLNNVDDMTFDAASGKILVSSQSSEQVYTIDPKRLVWTWAQTGYRINRVRAMGGKLLLASLYDGVLVEPRTGAVETVRK